MTRSADTKEGGFTPGPWQNGFDDLEGIVSLGAPDDGNVVCLPPLDLMKQSLSRWTANARLIAAAPDLFEVSRLMRLYGAVVSTGYTKNDKPDAIRLSSGKLITGEAAEAICELARGIIALAERADAALAKALTPTEDGR